jgi:hypothetical protein
MQWGIHTVEVRCGEVGLSNNSEEIELGVFTRKMKIPCFFEPVLFRINLYRSMSVKYLGVALDSPLTWREYQGEVGLQ